MDEDILFQRKLEEVDRAFDEHRTSEKGLKRLDVATLRVMCETRELGKNRKKDELIERLIHWVIIFLH